MKIDGELTPMIMRLSHTCQNSCDRFGWNRHLTLNSQDSRYGLTVKVAVDYPRFGGKAVVEQHFPVADSSDMLRVLFSRPLLQPPWIEQLLKKIGWPHVENVLKPSEFGEMAGHQFKNEIALHRMLDLLGAMALLAESGSYVAGSLDTDKGNHALDLDFLQELKPIARRMYPELESLVEPPHAEPRRFFSGVLRQEDHCL
jgi:hypothetical protein